MKAPSTVDMACDVFPKTSPVKRTQMTSVNETGRPGQEKI